MTMDRQIPLLSTSTSSSESWNPGGCGKPNRYSIDGKEYTWMHQLSTFKPVRLNIEYPFAIPLSRFVKVPTGRTLKNK